MAARAGAPASLAVPPVRIRLSHPNAYLERRWSLPENPCSFSAPVTTLSDPYVFSNGNVKVNVKVKGYEFKRLSTHRRCR